MNQDEFDHYTDPSEVEEDNELEYDQPDNNSEDEWFCELGEHCLIPHFYHRSSECYTRKMAEQWAVDRRPIEGE